MVGLKGLDRPKDIDFKVLHKLFAFQSAKGLQFDRPRAVHQSIQLVGESAEIARMGDGVKHQTLVVVTVSSGALDP